jgi:hypothetical protein
MKREETICRIEVDEGFYDLFPSEIVITRADGTSDMFYLHREAMVAPPTQDYNRIYMYYDTMKRAIDEVVDPDNTIF